METVTYWHCDRCNHGGQVEHERHEGAWQVMLQVVAAHKTVAADCPSEYYIRVSKHPITAVSE